jgi:hypothetical protein
MLSSVVFVLLVASSKVSSLVLADVDDRLLDPSTTAGEEGFDFAILSIVFGDAQSGTETIPSDVLYLQMNI